MPAEGNTYILILINERLRVKKMNPYKTVEGESFGEYTEKRSRFIAALAPVSSEEEALAFIENLRKTYWDARHNCFAYIIGGSGGISRAGDDGEPSGTAGRPMLEVLKGAGLSDVCLVVTRYFGGTLLGTGGLVRAYTAASEEAVANAGLVQMLPGIRLTITVAYPDAGKMNALFAKYRAVVLSSDYTDKVVFTLLVPPEEKTKLVSAVENATAARAVTEEAGEEYYRLKA